MQLKRNRVTIIINVIMAILLFLPTWHTSAGDETPRPDPASPGPEAQEKAPASSKFSPTPLLSAPGEIGGALQAAGDRLAALQNNDGGWDWPLDNGNPATGSALNTISPIGKGLAQIYLHSGDASHLAALQDVGTFLLAKTNNFSPSDGYLAAQLDQVFGGTTYRDHLVTNFYGPLAAGTYNRNGAGTLYSTASYVNLIRTNRTGSQANLAAWDLGMGLVGAASCGASTAEWIAGVKAEINELDGDNYYDVIGLAGAVYGLAFVDENFDPTAGEHAAAGSLDDLAEILAGYQIDNGGFAWNSNYVIPNDDNETIQETAYAILALNEVDRGQYLLNLRGAADYMIGVQLASGGWENYPGSGENNEVSAEAAWGISVAYPELWVCLSGDCGHPGASYNSIQAAVDTIAIGGNIYIAAGIYTEQVRLNKFASLFGAGSSTAGTILRKSGSTPSNEGIVQLSASGYDPNNPIQIQKLRIEPVGIAGLSVGRFTQATGISVDSVELDDVKVIGTNTSPCTEQERGLYVDLTSSLTHLVVKNSAFNNLHYGWYIQKQVSADTSTVRYVQVTDTTFNHNNTKGLYAEKLADATFTSVTVDDNGYDGSLLSGCTYFQPWMSGFDINLKAGTYQNLTVEDSFFTDNGLGGAKEGVGLAFKARSDGTTYGAFPATLTNVLVDSTLVSGNERGIRFGEPGKNNPGPTNAVVQQSCINGNLKTYSGSDGSAYGGLVNVSTAHVAAENNWWGDASGPTHASNPLGSGDAVYGDVSFTPWLDACGGDPTANWWNQTKNTYFPTLQAANDDAGTEDGDVLIPLNSGPIPGRATITKGVTIHLNGRTFTGGSPFLEVMAPDVTVLGPGVLDGTTAGADAIIIHGGGDNFRIEDVEIRNWINGVHIVADVESFKMVANWVHNQTGVGLLTDTGVDLSGVVTVEGNLFKDNGGPGVRHQGNGTLDVTYNSWGDDAGPTGPLGDGVDGSVVYDPWTFSEIYFDVDPGTSGDQTERHVFQTQSFDVELKGDAENLYGLSFVFSYDQSKLTLNSTTFSAPWASKCFAIVGLPAGQVGYYCALTSGDEWDGGTIATFNLTAAVAGESFFDIFTDTTLSSGATGGVKVFVNNAGYNDPSVAARDITDTDDGHIYTDLANFAGFVDLQGRSNDSGATIRVYTTNAGGTLLAQATSASSGKYTTVHEAGQMLQLGGTYYLIVDRALYLPTASPYPSASPNSSPSTTLNNLLLLGGDGTDDNTIDINDASCIGSAYGTSNNNCTGGTGANSDVNGDGVVNILDLTLMGGNYFLSYSPWLPQ